MKNFEQLTAAELTAINGGGLLDTLGLSSVTTGLGNALTSIGTQSGSVTTGTGNALTLVGAGLGSLLGNVGNTANSLGAGLNTLLAGLGNIGLPI